MKEKDLRTILASVNAAIEVYRRQTNRLRPGDAGVKSMLAALRIRLADQLKRTSAGADD